MSDSDLSLAARLADAAADAIRPFFRKSFAMEAKADLSPVTEADRAAEAAMRAILKAERPEDGVIGEEYGREREDAERVWVLDPIDGTPLLRGGTADLRHVDRADRPAETCAGHHQPADFGRALGWGGGSTDHAQRRRGPDARLRGNRAGASRHHRPRLLHARKLARVRTRPRRRARHALGGDCYNYGLLAAGHLDLVIEDGLKLYDFAALVPIVEGAGGVMRDWNGRPLDMHSKGQVIAAGDARLTETTVAALS